MSLALTNLSIIQLCGMLAYRKGEVYCRAGEVNIVHYELTDTTGTARITAEVGNGAIKTPAAKGSSRQMTVTLMLGTSGEIEPSCSCSPSFSFDKYCKHVAAALLFIYELQRNEELEPLLQSKLLPAEQLHTGQSSLLPPPSATSMGPTEQRLMSHVLNLFESKPQRPSRALPRFEQRSMLHVEFVCKPLTERNGQAMFGIELKLGPGKLYIVQRIRDFLEQLAHGNSSRITKSFSYVPELHCFLPSDDAILRNLIAIMQHEQLYTNTGSLSSGRHSAARVSAGYNNERLLLIPSLSWTSLLPLLIAASSVRLEHNQQVHDTFQLAETALPLSFQFDLAEDELYCLDVQGLDEMTVMKHYGVAVSGGKLYGLDDSASERLSELKQMLNHAGSNRVYITPDRVESFMVKVVPGLMKLGQIQLSRAVTNRVVQLPLKAKLYLDRIKDRLLASLEFHYGDIVINPLESNNPHTGQIIVRNGEQEEQILAFMEQGAFTKTESGYFMNGEEDEFDFLYTILPELEKLVTVYATSAVKTRLHPVNAFPKLSMELDERTDWLEFQFDMKGIDEDEIRQLIEALEEKRKYYRLRNGSLLPLDQEKLQAMIRVFNETGLLPKELTSSTFRLPAIRGLRLLDLQDAYGESTVVQLGKNFRKLLSDIRNPDYSDVQLPEQLMPILRDYQKYGFQWLHTLARYRFGGILADDMGLGKTLQSIAFIASKQDEIRTSGSPALIIAPSSLLYNWQHELARFAPQLRTVIADGSKALRTRLLADSAQSDVIITSYPLLRQDIQQYAAASFHTLLLDEAQMFKNYATQTAKSVKALRARYRFALTGTPIENSLDELWSILDAVIPGLFPERESFSKMPSEQIARIIRPFLLRRLKSDVLQELPPKIESQQLCGLLPEQKKLYGAYLAKLQLETLKHLDDDSFGRSRIKILAGLTRLRQICSHPALFVEGYKGSSSKFEQLLEIVEECQSAGKRALIFSQFTTMLEIIGRELGVRGIPFFYLDGQTPPAERVERCNRFNEGEKDIFLISLKAGGTGLNLTGADTVILYDLWWNPAVEQQAEDRAHRIGQEQVVHVIRLVTQGTVEEKMFELQKKKKSLIDEVLQPGQAASSALTEQDIREILALT